MSMRGFLIAVAGVGVVGMAAFEVTMEPTPTDRLMLVAIFLTMALATLLAAWSLPRFARRSRSLSSSIAALPVASLIVVTLAVTVAANQMFLSSHDLSLLLVVLATALLSAIVLTAVVSQVWASELSAMRSAAERIAAGDLDARTGMERRDEIGRLAAAIDHMAEELATAAAAQAHAERERRAFLAAIGHDLRTPLASLRAAVEAVRDGIAPDPERYLAAMEHDVVALADLVDNLFLLTRIEAGEIEIDRARVDVAELADEAIEVLRPLAARREVGLRLVASADRAMARGPEAVSRVLRNLLDNAIVHAPAGSDVVVELSNGDGVTVRVSDQGPGFDPSFVTEAFVSFRRDDPARSRATGGAGLGLAIAHGFVTALGGSIWAEPGPGGEVGFWLPGAGDEGSERGPGGGEDRSQATIR